MTEPPFAKITPQRIHPLPLGGRPGGRIRPCGRALRGAVLLAVLFGLAWWVTPEPARAVGFVCKGLGVRVLEQTLDRTVIELHWVDGEEASFGDAFTVAVPGSELPSVQLLEVETTPLSSPVDVPASQVFAPGPPILIRGVWVRPVFVSPFLAVAQGLVERVTRLVVALDHPASAALRGRLSRLERIPAVADGLLDPVVVNPRTAARLRAVRDAVRRKAVPVEDTFARSERWVRVEVDRSGLLRLDYAQLRSVLGDDVDLVDPASLRLFGAARRVQPRRPSDPGSSWRPETHLREHAIRVEASASALQPGDAVLAWVEGPDGWSDRFDPTAGPRDWDDDVFDERIAYWLTWDEISGPVSSFDAPPMRMVERDVTPTGAARLVQDARMREHFEQNGQMGHGFVRDGWLWRRLVAVGGQENFTFDLTEVVAESSAVLATEPLMERGGAATATFRAEYSVNGTAVATPQWSITDQTLPSRAPFRLRVEGIPIGSGANLLTVRNLSSGINGGPPFWMMDSFDIVYRRRLVIGAEALAWDVFEDEVTADERWLYRLSGTADVLDGVEIYALDDAFAPQHLVGGIIGPGPVLDFEVAMAAADRRHFVAVPAGAEIAPVGLSRRRPRRLREEVAPGGGPATGWDMVVLHPAVLRNAAEDLVALRRTTLPDRADPRVSAVDLQDVYDEFGHGTKDPAAIRNYLKFLFELDPRLEFVVLLGDANRDARGILPNSAPDLCPTWVQDFWPKNSETGFSTIPFARDDWLVSLDDPPSGGSGILLDLPDLAVGRLPAPSAAEARRMVQRIEDYETNPASGPWRNTLLLAADDEVGLASRNYRESFHTTEAECLSEELLPPALDVDKLYMTEFPTPPGDQAKPSARQAFRRRWSEGRLVVHYIGHGSPEQMADENLFRIEDVGSLENGDRLPLFLAFSCDVSIFDDPTKQSMSEALVLHPGGGAIATIAATQLTFVSQNEDLTEAFYGRLYADPQDRVRAARSLDRSQPIGRALVQAKWAVPGVNGDFSQSNNAKYVLLGDPALRLESPREDVELSGSLAASIASGREHEMVAALPGLPAASGEWYLEAKESADSVLYVMDKQADPSNPVAPGELRYVLDGSTFFRGRGSFDAGTFTARLRAPTFLRFGFAGRVRVLLEEGTVQHVGLAGPLPVVRAAPDSDDREGPKIQLAFEGEARTVQPGAVLEAVIEDPSGVNVLGTVPANSILVEFDGQGVSTDVTERFELDEDSFTKGRILYELPSTLQPGPHRLVLSAGDMLANRSSAELGFEVSAAGTMELGAHAPYPNPFAETTRFVAEVVAPAGTVTDLDLDIFTVDGRRVRTLRARIDSGGSRVILPWDGTDARGGEVANGTYLYVLRAHFPTDPPLTRISTGRVVRMR